MSASPSTAAAVQSSKRPLEDPSSPSAPTDVPEAKRQALDKVVKEVVAPVTSEPPAVIDETKKELEGKNEPIQPVNGGKDVQGDTVVPDAPNGTAPIPTIGTLPIQSSTSHDRPSSHPPQHMPPQDETNWIHIRAVISSAEAATCIGKGGENVSQIRRLANAKCTVSDYSRGAVERILTVSGQQDAVAKVRNCLSTSNLPS